MRHHHIDTRSLQRLIVEIANTQEHRILAVSRRVLGSIGYARVRELEPAAWLELRKALFEEGLPVSDCECQQADMDIVEINLEVPLLFRVVRDE